MWRAVKQESAIADFESLCTPTVCRIMAQRPKNSPCRCLNIGIRLFASYHSKTPGCYAPKLGQSQRLEKDSQSQPAHFRNESPNHSHHSALMIPKSPTGPLLGGAQTEPTTKGAPIPQLTAAEAAGPAVAVVAPPTTTAQA